MPTNADTPYCGAGEDLFQLRMIIEEEDDMPMSATYMVYTESTKKMHSYCVDCVNNFPGADVKLCLPRDGCHTAIISRSYGRKISCSDTGGYDLFVTWGHQTIQRSDAWIFPKLEFGDGCGQKEDPPCDTENDEILFEFFGERTYEAPAEASWSLTDTMGGEVFLEGTSEEGFSVSDFDQGTEPPSDAEVSFFYETTCVPRTSCLEFNMQYPFGPGALNNKDWSKYSFRLNGVVYSEDNMGLTRNIARTFGTNCTVETVCNATTEDLFALQLEGYAPDEYCSRKDADEFYNNDFSFELWKPPKNNSTIANVEKYIYSGIEANQKYAFLCCIPKDKCSSFYVNTDNQAKGYKIFQNGAELTQRDVRTGSSREYSMGGFTSTDLGVCAGGASKLSFAALKMASALATSTLLFAFL